MSELKDHLYFLLANNIVYNAAYDVFATVENSPTIEADPLKISTETQHDLAVRDNEQLNDEDFYIDVLAAADLPFNIYGACFCLTAYGTRKALPALIVKQETASETTIKEISNTINCIRQRASITPEQVEVLKNPSFRKIHWNKSAMAFFCQFCALIVALSLDIEDSRTIAFGDFLSRELNVELDGHDSINSYRICHIDTEAYFKEMSGFDKTLRSEVFLSNALDGTAITECRDSKLAEIYQEFMNEFLNVRLIQEFGKEQFRS